jgi:hypothetical protein
MKVTGSSELLAFFWCLEVEGCRFASEIVPTNHVTWGTSWGQQCYDHLGKICDVLPVHKKAVDNCPVEQCS